MEKGSYGYLNFKKKYQLRWTGFWAVVVVLFVVAGLLIWGTRMNFLMIPGMICVIPFANYFVTYVAFSPYESGTAEQYAQLQYFEEAGMLLSDLLLVDENGARAPMTFAVIYANGIVAYQSYKKDTRDKITLTVNDTMKRRGIPMRIKVYRSWEDFLARISEMSIPAPEDAGRVEMAREALLSLCM